MLAHRLRRWPNIKPALAQHLVFTRKLSLLPRDLAHTRRFSSRRSIEYSTRNASLSVGIRGPNKTEEPEIASSLFSDRITQ